MRKGLVMMILLGLLGACSNQQSLDNVAIMMSPNETYSVEPEYVGVFVNWENSDISKLVEDANDKFEGLYLTWEPWKPVQSKLGIEAQREVQERYTNRSIASGLHDEYITQTAKALSSFDGPVFLRFAHEMNGNWYPWSSDPDGYIASWQHIHDIFQEMEVSNVKFVFAPNASLYQSDIDWLDNVSSYYPGDSYVDVIGITTINFGGKKCDSTPCVSDAKDYSVKLFKERMNLLVSRYPAHNLMLPEINTTFETREEWISDLVDWVKSEDFEVVALMQGDPRSSDQFETGDLGWSVLKDEKTMDILLKAFAD